MAKNRHEDKPGYGKLLDAWVAPEDAGDPVGCLATSFTFSPVFFEEECLARFLQLESDPTEDGPVYLVEREEKLAQVTCAAALIDQHHCRGSRSLRWDLLAARIPHGLQHAKVSFLYWSQMVRIIISSANLTDDGYRRNQEVFGVLDFRPGSESPVSCLVDIVAFLRRVVVYSSKSAAGQSPAVNRWNALLDRAEDTAKTWGLTNEELRRTGIQVRAVLSGPGYPTVFEGLSNLWPAPSPPEMGCVLSPFFDRAEVSNVPATQLWELLRRRGEATVEYHVAAEDIPGEDGVFLQAPESLLHAQPTGRSAVATDFYRVTLAAGRSLHAKGIWLEDDRWSVYLLGSSNFTSAGTGIAKESNLEANLAYIVDSNRDVKAKRRLETSFPESEYVVLDQSIKWKPLSGEGEDAVGEEVSLPPVFGDAMYDCDDKQRATISLSLHGRPPDKWELIVDGEEERFFGEHEWLELGKPSTCRVDWQPARPPSGFWVKWQDSGGSAWWPVNVTAGSVLPPPEELKNLPLEVLISILSSARPLHRVIGGYLRRRERGKAKTDGAAIVDPHKRVDTSRFLLQRTRRISWALNALRERLERPVVTREFLQWRLRGPVGVLSLAEALVRDAKSDEERAFLISELALELARAKPATAPGCLPAEEHASEIRSVICELKTLIPSQPSHAPENLRQYVESVFDAVSA